MGFAALTLTPDKIRQAALDLETAKQSLNAMGVLVASACVVMGDVMRELQALKAARQREASQAAKAKAGKRKAPPKGRPRKA